MKKKPYKLSESNSAALREPPYVVFMHFTVVLLLELVLLGLLVVLPELGEGVKKVVDDLCREDPDSQAVGHLLTLPLHLHVEGQDHGVPAHR